MNAQPFTYADVLTLLSALDDYEQTASDNGNPEELARATDLYNRFDAMRFPARPPVSYGPPAAYAPRGWYRDPWQLASLRYWDSSQWTPRTRETRAAVIVTKRTGDLFTNLALTVVTLGLWAPVWMVRSAERSRVRPIRHGPP